MTEIIGFGNLIDEKLIDIISKIEWTNFDNGKNDKVPDDIKILVGIYYYPKEKENSSFLSQYDH